MIINQKEDFHVHANYNDHSAEDLTVENVIKRAEEIGLETLAFTEHIRRSSDWMENYLADIKNYSKNSKVKILSGFEGKILEDGSIDCPKKYAEDYFLIASFHTKYEDKKTWFNALITAIKNPDVNVIGHLAPEPNHTIEPNEIEAIAKTAANHNKIVEINAKYIRPPLEWISIFRDNGVKFHLGSDAHALENIGNFEKLTEQISLAQKNN